MNPNSHASRQEQHEPVDSLDRVLNALNSVTPTTGMDQRILHAVEVRMAAEPFAREPRLSWMRTLRIAPALTFATALALLLFVFVRLFQTHTTGFPEQITASQASASFEGPSLQIDDATAHKMDPMPKPILGSTRLPSSAAHPSGVGVPKPPFLLVAHSIEPPEAEGPPASFPAPPMPLTPQERLLLRIAHRNDPESIDALIPEKRAAREAEDNHEFQTFFPEPKPVEYPALLLSQVHQPAGPHGDKQ